VEPDGVTQQRPVGTICLVAWMEQQDATFAHCRSVAASHLALTSARPKVNRLNPAIEFWYLSAVDQVKSVVAVNIVGRFGPVMNEVRAKAVPTSLCPILPCLNIVLPR
jgi:hypothetical protein